MTASLMRRRPLIGPSSLRRLVLMRTWRKTTLWKEPGRWSATALRAGATRTSLTHSLTLAWSALVLSGAESPAGTATTLWTESQTPTESGGLLSTAEEP
jgi:hypothetical protein